MYGTGTGTRYEAESTNMDRSYAFYFIISPKMAKMQKKNAEN